MRPRQANDFMRVMPDISGVSISWQILNDCADEWELRGFQGPPPNPYEVAIRPTACRQVIIAANFRQFVKDEPKRKREFGF